VKLDVERLRRNEPEAIKSLYTACRQYAKAGASRMGAGDFADDIAQDMFLHITARLLDAYDPERDIDGWMMTYAQRATQAMKRKHRWHREFHSEGLETLSAADDDVEAQLEQEEDARRAAEALEELNRRARRAGFGDAQEQRSGTTPVQTDAKLHSKQRVARWQHKMRSRPDVRELEARSRHLGLTHPQLAALCGVSLHHLRGVLYGRIKGTPQAFLDKLDAFEAQQESATGAAVMPIQQKMKRWCQRLRLGNDPGWYLTLGEALGIHRATVYRWRNGLSQPQPYVVRFLDACVEAQARRLGAAASGRQPSAWKQVARAAVAKG